MTSRNLALLIAVGGLAACDDGFTPAQPVLGQILYEWQGTVPASGVALVGAPGGPLPRLTVPGNAVPAGTTLTVRLTSPITKSAPAGWPLPPFGGEVLQILPEGLTFSPPIRFSGGGLSTTTSVFINHLFRASDGDAAWTWSTSIETPRNSGDPFEPAPIDRSGLWVQGRAPASTVAGTYRLTSMSCKGPVIAAPAGVYLTLMGDHYALTAADPPCHDEGAFTSQPSPSSPSTLTLTTGARALGFDVQAGGTTLRLKTSGDLLGTCGAASVGSIILFLDYVGCATDADCGAGGQCNGQLCGPAPSTATASCLADITGATGGGK